MRIDMTKVREGLDEIAARARENSGEVKELNADDLAAVLPRPTGYRLLIAVPKVDETYKGSVIVKAASTQQVEELTTLVGLVLDMGEDAYKDKAKFPEGPWCKVGDYVLMRAYSGTRFKVDGREYRLINDDTVEAVVSDPSRITRAV